jgi:hypothetical protein
LDDKAVYRLGNGPDYAPYKMLYKIEGADSETFKVISESDESYLADKNFVYFYGSKLENADVNTFELLDFGYAKDKNSVYFSGDSTKMEGVEAESFQVLNEYYTKDKNAVYFGAGDYMWSIQQVKNVDVETFETIDGQAFYAKDKNNIYFSDGGAIAKVIENTDPQTFEVLGNNYSKDKNSVYSKDKLMPNADLDSFKLLKHHYAKDEANVYYGDKILTDADPSTFKIITYQLTKDDNNLYESGIKMSDDNFQAWNVYEDSEAGFRFNYPSSSVLEDNAVWDKEIYHFLQQEESDGLLVPEFVFEVIDKKTNNDLDEVIFDKFHFYSGTFEEFKNDR